CLYIDSIETAPALWRNRPVAASASRSMAMREEGTSRSMGSGLMARRGHMEGLGNRRAANRATRSRAWAADNVIFHVRRAMQYVESDHQAALRCLHVASTLLGADAQESRANARLALSGFQSGGLARWQAKRALAYIEENLESKLATRELAALVSFSRS